MNPSSQLHCSVMRCGQHGGMETTADLIIVPSARPLAAEGPVASETPRKLRVRWARHADDVAAAQQLRFRVFAQEMGAQLWPPAGTPEGLDADRFDPFCEHLLVETQECDHGPAEVVGTYRLLTPDGARRAGGLYSESEFDLAPLQAWRPVMAELGRSCTAPEWRHGVVILMLWRSMARFLHQNNLRIMVGCASVPMRDGGHHAASLWQRLRDQHLVAQPWRVRPLLPLPVHELRTDLPAEPPPLIKGYLRCGAQLLGAPAWDPDFGVADLPMMLDLARLDAAQRARLLRG
jgi:putative hemolysin